MPKGGNLSRPRSDVTIGGCLRACPQHPPPPRPSFCAAAQAQNILAIPPRPQKMAAVTWGEVKWVPSVLGCRVVAAATDVVSSARHPSQSDIAPSVTPAEKFHLRATGSARRGEDQAYVSEAAIREPCFCPHGAQQRGEEQSLDRTHAAYLEVPE